MKHKSGIVKGSMVLGFLMALALLSVLWHGGAVERKSDSGMGIFLTAPAFAQEAEMSFLEREAGMAAYVSLDQEITLSRMKDVFRTLERETDIYIVGSLPVPGYSDDTNQDVHCFIHKDGWVVVYYPSTEPTSRMMYWRNWDGGEVATKLDEALISISNMVIGVGRIDTKYYHFGYPNASNLMIIACKSSFRLTIPNEIAVYEGSFDGAAYIDSKSLGNSPGRIAIAQLKSGISHWITGKGNKAIFLVYQENYGEIPSDADIALTEPEFAQEPFAGFLEKEAGIAAYINLGRTVDLTKVISDFRVTEKETDSFLIGSLPIVGYERSPSDDVHCFIHKDGWIVVYYMKDEIVSKIMHWKNWNGKIISNKLEEGLATISSAIGTALPRDVKYYHFKYPSANRLMMIGDRGTFRITIPNELVIYEISYSMGSGRCLVIDGRRVSGEKIGLITSAQLKQGMQHTISQEYCGVAYSSNDALLALVYQE